MKLNNDDAEKLMNENDADSFFDDDIEKLLNEDNKEDIYGDEPISGVIPEDEPISDIIADDEADLLNGEEFEDDYYGQSEYDAESESDSADSDDEEMQIGHRMPEYTDEELGEQECEDNYNVAPERLKRAGKRRRVVHRGRKLCIGLVMTVIIVGASVLLSMIILYLGKEALGIDKSSATYAIEIPKGATVDDIIVILTDKQEEQNFDKIINVPQMFKVLVKLNKKESSFVAGEHILRPDMSYGDIIEELSKKVERKSVSVMFPEGITLAEAAELLEENSVCSAERFIYFFNLGLGDYNFEKYLPVNAAGSLKFYPMEGYFFPDTYDFYVTKAQNIPDMEESEYQVIVRKIYANFDRKFPAEYIKRSEELGMTMDEVVTLASIIQREAGNVSQMGKISSVFHNRLNNSAVYPKLESDPTKKYVDIIKKYSKVKNEVMNAAYNTYESAGLPPGAISNPGAEAIKAALYPEETPYYFFCANVETKETLFAETVAQHEENLKIAGLK